MNAIIANVGNIFTVHTLTADFIMRALAAYRDKFGDNIKSIAHGLGIGCLLADYCFQAHEDDLIAIEKPDDLAKAYERFRTAMFFDVHGRPILPGHSIGIVDRVNKRDVYVIVGLPGNNTVVYQKSEDSAAITEVSMIGSVLMSRSMRMEPVWKDGNNHDKILLAHLMGFDYDRHDDEILVPQGRMESAVAIGRRIAVETVNQYKEFNG